MNKIELFSGIRVSTVSWEMLNINFDTVCEVVDMQGRKYVRNLLSSFGDIEAKFGNFTVPVNNTLMYAVSSFVFLAAVSITFFLLSENQMWSTYFCSKEHNLVTEDDIPSKLGIQTHNILLTLVSKPLWYYAVICTPWVLKV